MLKGKTGREEIGGRGGGPFGPTQSLTLQAEAKRMHFSVCCEHQPGIPNETVLFKFIQALKELCSEATGPADHLGVSPVFPSYPVLAKFVQ